MVFLRNISNIIKMALNKILQVLINILILGVFTCLVLYAYDSKIIERYVFDEPMEECVYDPVVQKLKNKVLEFLEQRRDPWKGHLTPLNDKKKQAIHRLKLCKGDSSYTINKSVVYLCVHDKEGSYYDEHMLMHVLLHEFAHALCDEIGHTKKFDDIFSEFMDECHMPTCSNQKPIYDKTLPLLDNYCGVGPDDSYDTKNP
jgi:hypothetical protein